MGCCVDRYPEKPRTNCNGLIRATELDNLSVENMAVIGVRGTINVPDWWEAVRERGISVYPMSTLKRDGDRYTAKVPLDIVGVETTREADGLALSSRNVYLLVEERATAPALNRVLREVAEKAQAAVSGGARRASKAPRPVPLVRDPTLPPQAHQLPGLISICEAAAAELTAAGFTKVDYVAVRAAETLQVVSDAGPRPLRVLGAAWLGTTRLIDNVAG